MKIDHLYKHLPERLSKALIKLKCSDIKEIRLRANAPVSVTCKEGNVTFDSYGNRVLPKDGIILTYEEIERCVRSLCKMSMYSFEENIKKGFIPIEGGGRAGVCGNTVWEKGRIISVNEITSVNIRLESFLPHIAKETASLMKKNHFGILIYSPPGVGKTTYLKSLSYLLSIGECSPPYRVGIIDERFELSWDISKMGFCDVIKGAPKNYALELLTRTMSPEIIICDEITSADKDAILEGCNSGVSFICSVHGNDFENISKRPFIKELLKADIFRAAVGIECLRGEYKYKTNFIGGDTI